MANLLELKLVDNSEDGSDQMDDSDKESDSVSTNGEMSSVRSLKEKKKKERKIKKQMMERNRRSRMSSSLQAIASFLVENKIMDKSKKCEKVDILESLAEYLEKTTGTNSSSSSNCRPAVSSDPQRPALNLLSSGDLNSRLDLNEQAKSEERPEPSLCPRTKPIPLRVEPEVTRRLQHELCCQAAMPAFQQTATSCENPSLHHPNPISIPNLYSTPMSFHQYPSYHMYGKFPVVRPNCIPAAPLPMYFNRQSSPTLSVSPNSAYSYQPTAVVYSSPAYSDSSSSCVVPERPPRPVTPGLQYQSQFSSVEGSAFVPCNLPR